MVFINTLYMRCFVTRIGDAEVNHPGIRSRPRGLKEAVKVGSKGGGRAAQKINECCGCGNMVVFFVFPNLLWSTFGFILLNCIVYHCKKFWPCHMQTTPGGVHTKSPYRWQVSEDALAIHRKLNDQSGEAWTSLQGWYFLLKGNHVYHVRGF